MAELVGSGLAWGIERTAQAKDHMGEAGRPQWVGNSMAWRMGEMSSGEQNLYPVRRMDSGSQL